MVRGRVVNVEYDGTYLAKLSSGRKINVGSCPSYIRKGDWVPLENGRFLDKTVEGSIVVMGRCDPFDDQVKNAFFGVLGFGDLFGEVREVFNRYWNVRQDGEYCAISNPESYKGFDYFWSHLDEGLIFRQLSGLLADYSNEGGRKTSRIKFIDIRDLRGDWAGMLDDPSKKKEVKEILWHILRKDLLC